MGSIFWQSPRASRLPAIRTAGFPADPSRAFCQAAPVSTLRERREHQLRPGPETLTRCLGCGGRPREARSGSKTVHVKSINPVYFPIFGWNLGSKDSSPPPLSLYVSIFVLCPSFLLSFCFYFCVEYLLMVLAIKFLDFMISTSQEFVFSFNNFRRGLQTERRRRTQRGRRK